MHADILAGAKDLSSNCIYCPDQFKTRAELDEHMKTAHLREKTYMCDTCGKSFSTRAAMKRHNDHVHLKLKETVRYSKPQLIRLPA